jgi:hypothetical protein
MIRIAAFGDCRRRRQLWAPGATPGTRERTCRRAPHRRRSDEVRHQDERASSPTRFRTSPSRSMRCSATTTTTPMRSTA